jgi:hypothetical protein
LILEIGSETAVSFTDDTSLDSRTTNNEKVSVHAEIVREKPLDWYIKLVSLYPDIKGELKSSSVTDCFFSLAETERNRLISTLKFVRIHIADPRPYFSDVKKAIKNILPNNDVDGFLARLKVAQNEAAQRLEDMLKRQAAIKMAYDSPSERLKFWLRLVRQASGWGFAGFLDDDGPFYQSRYADNFFSEFDFTPFEDKKGYIRLNSLSVYSSKSGPVFTDVLDDISNNPTFYTEPLSSFSITKKLSLGRAYDKGDDKAIDWIRDKREEVIRAADRFGRYSWLTPRDPIESLESHKSILLQAADFAAGIAKTILEREGLVPLVKTFEYVIYNGSRISEDDALKVIRSWSTK